MRSNAKHRRSNSQLTFVSMVARLYAGPASCEELVDHTGLHAMTVSRYVRAMHAERIAHIVAWLPDTLGRDASPVFAFGPGADKRKRRMTDAQRSARSRQKKARARHDAQMKGLFDAPPVSEGATHG
jgi:hypothetical protein